MLEEIRKSLLGSLGAAFLTKSKIEDISRRMVEEGKLNREEARKLADELVETGERQWDEVEKSVSRSFTRGMKNLDVASTSELEKLKRKVARLEKRVKILEGMLQQEKEK
jgi:polyhydroxyalkanoate synthesis regulator phasin